MSLDIVSTIDDLTLAKQAFILSPKQWKTLKISALQWDYVKFTGENKNDVPQKRGIYLFIIRHEHAALPTHGYIAYVGLTGNKNPRTLRIRYGEYLREKVRAKRLHINRMLNRWDEDLYFYFSVIEDKRISLPRIETALLDALVPPYNEKDFSGDLGKKVKAAWK